MLGREPIPSAGRVLAFNVGISLLAGLLVGAGPALHIGRSDLVRPLKAAGGVLTATARRHRLQRFFVGVEVALALMLLVGGGLLVHSFLRLQRVDPGFRTDDILTMRLTLPWEEYPLEAIAPFFGELVERVEALPGVERVGVGSQFPTVAFSRAQLTIEGREAAGEGALPVSLVTAVDPGYFDTLGIPLLAGRNLEDAGVADRVEIRVRDPRRVERWSPTRSPGVMASSWRMARSPRGAPGGIRRGARSLRGRS